VAVDRPVGSTAVAAVATAEAGPSYLRGERPTAHLFS